MKGIAVILLALLAVAIDCVGRAHAENIFDESKFHSMVSDPRAYRVGDSVTVLIVEAATAETRADSTEDADFSIKGGISGDSDSHGAGLSLATGSGGAGRTSRSGQLRAMISARIDSQLPSGDFVLRGSQLITVNGEQQRISVQGAVRPTDISSDNTVLSTRLSDAKIDFIGEGWVARNQRPGLFRRLLQFVGF